MCHPTLRYSVPLFISYGQDLKYTNQDEKKMICQSGIRGNHDDHPRAPHPIRHRWENLGEGGIRILTEILGGGYDIQGNHDMIAAKGYGG